MLEPDVLVHNRYRVIQLIGEGGMGSVYEAVDQRLATTVALKQTHISGAQYERAFQREAQLLSRLRHPALPKVIDYFADGNNQFLVMEFIHGTDLGTLLERQDKPFPVADVLTWADQLLDALQYLHTQQLPIIHRDIKPQNLKLTPSGAITLLDFGLAKGAAEFQTQPATGRSIFGYTPQYAPPEQIQGTGTDQRSDIYALGATLYALIIGAPPESAPTRLDALVRRHPDPLRPAHEVNRQVPPAVGKALMRAMDLDPGKRFPSAAEMRAALQSIHSQVWQPAVPWRWLTLGGGALAALALIAFLVMPVLPTDPNRSTTPTTATNIVVANAPATEVVPTGAATVIPEDTSTTSNTASSAAETATPDTAQTAAAVDEQIAIIAAERPERAATHLSGNLVNATAQYDRTFENLLLENGYTANIIDIRGRQGLGASRTDPIDAIWARDLDYATSGFSYVLGDMQVLRASIELLLEGVTGDGVVPEGLFSNQTGYVYGTDSDGAWDSMPNLISAVYTYVAKTGDYDFYRTHREALQQIGTWIVRLDSDGNGLPDRDIFPHGYYNSVHNSVMHTYALAKFYGAFIALAELERAIDEDGSIWTQRADRLRQGFHLPLDQGGYWPNDQVWPIAWRQGDGSVVNVLETFGVFEALHSGLIAPADAARYRSLLDALRDQVPTLLNGPVPMRLVVGGYEQSVRRDVVPANEQWKLDASAPWIVGLAAPEYAADDDRDSANALMQAYAAMDRVPRLAAGPNDRYGAGQEGGGGAWERAAWFMAIYGGHYGLKLTPAALIVRPRPFTAVPDDGIQNVSYQGAYVQLALDPDNRTYRIQVSRPTLVHLWPMGVAHRMRIDDGPAQSDALLILQPNHEYVIVSEES